MPEEIEGAKVIIYIETDYFGFVDYEDGEIKEIQTLAICNYDNKEEYYLFACDRHFNVLGDTLHGSIEGAMEFAKEYYEKIINWR